jgi:hypothetical protein
MSDGADADVRDDEGGGDDEVTIPVGHRTTDGEPVEMPVIEMLTGRGFVTGKSGSGKSNTASVVAERLLDRELGLMIVDVDGEYYGLKEEYEVLHAGADEECDIQVSPEHAAKLAELALEGGVPIILDVSGYLDEDVADELVRNVARQLFAKEKKLKQPFLLVVEECHEYIPEGGGLTETGRMLVKVGKRGRKHGLGILGISQRPANVKKDFITQCDWLVWHRLTWRNDTKVVKRILGSEYAEGVEDLDAGEAYLMTDWAESIRRVQFDRKRTFDAGATPGLDDVERPDLKSVSSDLVDDLRDISETRERRESELADLRQELDRKEARIEELERELEEARNLERMAERFSQALLQRAEALYRDVGPDATEPASPGRGPGEEADDAASADVPAQVTLPASANAALARGAFGATDEEVARAVGAVGNGSAAGAPDGDADDAGDGVDPQVVVDGDGDDTVGDGDGAGTADGDDAGHDTPAGSAYPTGRADGDVTTVDPGAFATAGPAGAGVGDGRGDADGPSDGAAATAATADEGAEILDDEGAPERPATDAFGTREAVVDGLSRRVEALDRLPRRMLDHSREVGDTDPVSAHVAAGGDGDEAIAYGRNRPLRKAGFVRHAGGERYEYAVPDLLQEACADRLDDEALSAAVDDVESRL